MYPLPGLFRGRLDFFGLSVRFGVLDRDTDLPDCPLVCGMGHTMICRSRHPCCRRDFNPPCCTPRRMYLWCPRPYPRCSAWVVVRRVYTKSRGILLRTGRIGKDSRTSMDGKQRGGRQRSGGEGKRVTGRRERVDTRERGSAGKTVWREEQDGISKGKGKSTTSS